MTKKERERDEEKSKFSHRDHPEWEQRQNKRSKTRMVPSVKIRTRESSLHEAQQSSPGELMEKKAKSLAMGKLLRIEEKSQRIFRHRSHSWED